MRLNFGKCAHTIVRRICRDLGRHHRSSECNGSIHSKPAGDRRGCRWYCHSCNNFNAATAASFNRPRVTITGPWYYLYSDGVTEAHDPGGDLFCEHRLEAVLRTHAGRGSREVVGGVTEALRGFVGTAPPFDDITMLALRWLDAAASSPRKEIH